MTDEQLRTCVMFEEKLKGLGIAAKVVDIQEGPKVTAYELKLHNKVPINKVLNKAEDFALAAGCDKVIVQRIADKVVIFASNNKSKDVDFKDTLNYIMTDPEAKKAKIPIPLGVDHVGVPSFIDLVECPHILIAGSTGSGKSVFESAILSILQVARSSKQVEVCLVDTKQMDLPLFAELPIVSQCCTTLLQYHQMIDRIQREHERRAIKFSNVSVRNIADYNTMYGPDNSLPYIAILIDEFADLLLQDREMRREKDSIVKEYTRADLSLQRLAQVGRATGIHLICATQRTSTKIVSGDVKTNFPCRISLRLPTFTDSITILGTTGAESLLGNGDMLIQRPGSEVLKRYHGPYVKYDDILYVVHEHQQLKDLYAMMGGEKSTVY